MITQRTCNPEGVEHWITPDQIGGYGDMNDVRPQPQRGWTKQHYQVDANHLGVIPGLKNVEPKYSTLPGLPAMYYMAL